MEKKTLLTAVFISVLLLSAVAGSQPMNFASAQTTSVIIKAGGSISPSTAPIQRVGELYILKGDVGEIWIGRSNITLDGNGYTVSKSRSFFSEKRVNLYFVKNVTVKNLTVTGGAYGIFLDRASNVTVSNNTVEGTSVPFPQSQGTSGIYVSGGGDNIIVGNRLENNIDGISLVNSIEHNTISENNITGNRIGIRFRNASNNIIYHNNFINNDVHVVDFGAKLTPSLNTWDGGLFSGGNFWSDYNGTDENGDGIGDKPYKVNDNNQDLYPLMKPWHPTIPFDTVPPRISISSPVHKVYNDSSVQLIFSIYESSPSMSYSMDGQDKVTVAGNTTLNELPNGSHNLTVYVTDQSGNIGVSEIIYFSVEVPEPFPTTLVVASVVLVAVVGAGLIIYNKHKR